MTFYNVVELPEENMSLIIVNQKWIIDDGDAVKYPLTSVTKRMIISGTLPKKFGVYPCRVLYKTGE